MMDEYDDEYGYGEGLDPRSEHPGYSTEGQQRSRWRQERLLIDAAEQASKDQARALNRSTHAGVLTCVDGLHSVEGVKNDAHHTTRAYARGTEPPEIFEILCPGAHMAKETFLLIERKLHMAYAFHWRTAETGSPLKGFHLLMRMGELTRGADKRRALETLHKLIVADPWQLDKFVSVSNRGVGKGWTVGAYQEVAAEVFCDK